MKKLKIFLASIITLGNKFIYNILDYVAVGDSQTINTKAIQNAIDVCSKQDGMFFFLPENICQEP